MKIIEQRHEIISLPENLLETLEKAGRTCYKSEDKIGCSLNEGTECYYQDNLISPECDEYHCLKHSSHKFIQTLIKRGHHAMIEFGDIIVKFITNRGVSHELVRHRICSFAQESTRYVKYDGEMEFIKPVWLNNLALGTYQNHKDYEKIPSASPMYSFLLSCSADESTYKYLLDYEWRPEQAREVLPNSLKTEIVVKANIREWRHIFSLRTSKAAHPQMRALMIPLLEELKEKLPVVFDDIEVK